MLLAPPPPLPLPSLFLFNGQFTLLLIAHALSSDEPQCHEIEEDCENFEDEVNAEVGITENRKIVDITRSLLAALSLPEPTSSVDRSPVDQRSWNGAYEVENQRTKVQILSISGNESVNEQTVHK